jgi:ubiquinone/menaquinone biosynthesis C-methylase UbiE
MFDAVASVYDRGMLLLEWLIFRRLRKRLFSPLKGDVLELGTGTGINLPLYGPDAYPVACDRSLQMLRFAAGRAASRQVPLVRADVQRLPFRDGAFGVVTASLLLCSVANPARALAEARRVLRATGRLVLLEHMRGEGLGRLLTDLLTPLWRVWSRECHLNRETVLAVVAAGFRLRRMEPHALGIVRIVEAVP